MAYPYQISSSARLPVPILEPGPYVSGSARYVTLHDLVNNHVEVWKGTASVDPGDTWAEQDSGNHKSVQSSPADNRVVDTHFAANGKLYITYVGGGGTTIDVAEFDPAADLWGAVVSGGPTPQFGRYFKTRRRLDGTFVCVYTHDVSSRRQVSLATYSGSWSGATAVFESGVTDTDLLSYWLKAVLIDASDNIHILAAASSGGSGGTYRYCRYSAAGSLSAVVKLNSFIEHQGVASVYAGAGILYTPGSASLLAFPLILNDAVGSIDTAWPGVIVLPSGATPGSGRADLIFESIITDDGSNTHEPHPSAVFIDPALYLYWPRMDATPDFFIRRACSKLGGWTAPSAVFTPSAGTAQQIRYVAARAVSATKVGIAFSAGQESGALTYEYPHYYEETPSCAADSGCSGGSGNINAARH